MSAMYRLKAYFGMVPAEEMGDYAEETVGDRYGDPRRVARPHADARWEDGREDADEAEAYGEWERRPSRSAVAERPRESVRAGSAALTASSALGATRGALAMEHEPAAPPVRPVAAASSGVPEQRTGLAGAQALSKITTLQPKSYNEARTIGERYRDGQPVIMNLTELDDAAAKRLVDFAAGLAFALRGSIDKVTSRVFLLTPADVEVSADDARRLAERTVGTARGAGGRAGSVGRVESGRSFAAPRVEDRAAFRQD